MLVKKIVSVKNAGRLKEYSATGDVEFKKFTLIYGENGRGKTTLCAIFRSLQSGDSSHIIGRTTLGVVGVPSVHIQLENGHTQFHDLTWSQTLPNLLIFDQDFISDNIYSGNAVGLGQRRNLYKIIIGTNGVNLARQYEAKKDKITALNVRIRAESNLIQSHLPPTLTIEAFLNTPNADGVDEHIATTQREITAASESAVILNHTPLKELQILRVPDDLGDTMRLNIDSISVQTESVIRQHIADHGMGKGGQEWISQGLAFNSQNECPFCAQDIQANDLLQVYRNFFSEAYRNLKASIIERGKSFAESFGDAQIQAITNSINENIEILSFWQRYLDLSTLPVFNVEDIVSSLNRAKDSILRLLKAKAASPLEVLEMDGEFSSSLSGLNALNEQLNQYNSSVRGKNELIQTRKNSLQQVNLNALKGDLVRFEALKNRFQEPLASHCATLLDLRRQKLQMEQEKDGIKAQLDNYSTATFGNYQRTINGYLDKFNAGFSIGNVDPNFIGGANAQFNIIINNNPVRLGDDQTPLNQPSFKNTLSSGDKSTLALAFFLAQIDHHPAKDQLVVLFDDPFNSQDSFRRNQTAIEIFRLGTACKQTIVLSHDAVFLKQVQDKIHGAPVKTLQLIPIGEENSKIENLDLNRFLQPEMRALMQRLQDYLSASVGDPKDIVRDIRPFLEGHCRTMCLALFTDDAMLSEILTHTRDNMQGHPLALLYNDLSDLNDYTCRYHHADGRITPAVNQTELLAYVKRALKIVGAH